VDERSGADADVTMARKLALRETMEFCVEKSKELSGGIFVTLFCQFDERRNSSVGRPHGIPNRAQRLALRANSQDPLESGSVEQ
jgi:hypothetical protein